MLQACETLTRKPPVSSLVLVAVYAVLAPTQVLELPVSTIRLSGDTVSDVRRFRAKCAIHVVEGLPTSSAAV